MSWLAVKAPCPRFTLLTVPVTGGGQPGCRSEVRVRMSMFGESPVRILLASGVTPIFVGVPEVTKFARDDASHAAVTLIALVAPLATKANAADGLKTMSFPAASRPMEPAVPVLGT